MTRIAITSVGSLVGQNILDALHGRRDGIEVVGINSAAEAASNFRCERAYLAPAAASGGDYLRRLSSILRDEAPELVLPGRDDDVPARSSVGRDGIVTKSLTEFAIRPADIERLQADGCWQRAGTATS